MNAYEYLQALRAALSALPDDEIDSAMRYYEDYFLDAGDENAAQVIEQLGPPEQVAQAILNEYTGVARRRPPHFDEDKAEPVEGVPLGKDGKPVKMRKKGISPWLLLLLAILAIPGRPAPAGRTACHGIRRAGRHRSPGHRCCGLRRCPARSGRDRRRRALRLFLPAVGDAGLGARDARHGPGAMRRRRALRPAHHQAVYPLGPAHHPRPGRGHPLADRKNP